LVDLYPHTGPLGAICTALRSAKNDLLFVMAGDMPFISTTFLHWAISQIPQEADAAVPKSEQRFEPLCAFYKKTCLSSMEKRLKAQEYKISSIFPDIALFVLDVNLFPEIQKTPYLFYNINTLEDWDHYLQVGNSPMEGKKNLERKSNTL
jgi:molybdopterin-guanine dinucleotide biosynthesis protein A